MSCWLVQQANGKFARFSTIVDDFTHIDMTEQEAFKMYHDHGGLITATTMLDNAKNKVDPVEDALGEIKRIHGEELANLRRELFFP